MFSTAEITTMDACPIASFKIVVASVISAISVSHLVMTPIGNLEIPVAKNGGNLKMCALAFCK